MQEVRKGYISVHFEEVEQVQIIQQLLASIEMDSITNVLRAESMEISSI